MTELAIMDQSATVDIGRWSETLVFASRLADAVGGTEFVPAALRDKPEAVAACIIYGAEIGITPMQALQSIHIVDGRPSPSAELMRAMILRAGHSLTVHEATGTRARVSGQRRGAHDSERVHIEWTMDMARAAGLASRPQWQRYPRAMLVARATSDLARYLFPDAIKGLGYIAEDESVSVLESWGPPEVTSPDPAPPRKSIQRKRAAAKSEPPPVAPPAPLGDTPRGDAPPSHGGRVPSGVAPIRATETVPLPPMSDEDAKGAQDALEAGGTRFLTDDEPSHEPPPYAGYRDEDEPLPPEAQPRGTGRPLRVMPDLEPEAPAEETPQLIGTGMWRALQAGLTEQLGNAATPEERHALAAAILHREVPSTKTLSRDEAVECLAYFAKFEDGSAVWEFTLDPEGPLIRVTDVR